MKRNKFNSNVSDSQAQYFFIWYPCIIESLLADGFYQFDLYQKDDDRSNNYFFVSLFLFFKCLSVVLHVYTLHN